MAAVSAVIVIVVSAVVVVVVVVDVDLICHSGLGVSIHCGSLHMEGEETGTNNRSVSRTGACGK